MTLGDSISAGGGWQAELARLMAQDAGVCADIRNEAVSGTGMGYWPPRINALLAQHNPDLVVLAAGTNDDTRTAAGRDALGTAFRLTVEAIHTYRTPAIPVAPVLIQYSDPLLAAQWVLDSQPFTNDVLYTNMQLYVGAGWFPGIVDWQVIPATADYLVDWGHPSPRGSRYMGRLVYDRIHATLGWPACSEPPLCGLYGHRKGYERPAYTECPEVTS